MNTTPNNQYKDELKELFDKVFSSTDNKEAEESLKSAKEICDYQFISWRALIEKFERLNDLGILKISQERRDLLKSTIQSAEAQAEADSITAAQFLQRFVEEGIAWAHLDIAH